METWALILAAGQGSRLLSTIGIAKQFFLWKGIPLYWQSVLQFIHCARIRGIVLVFPSEVKDNEEKVVDRLAAQYDLKLPYIIISGGKLRQDSVKNALNTLPKSCSHVLIHDAARPFISPKLINNVIDVLETGAVGVVPGISVTDTIKQVIQGEVIVTPPREQLIAVQTPQGFHLKTIVEGHNRAIVENWTVTDDASLLELCGHTIKVINGEIENRKISFPQDLLYMVEQPKTTIPIVGYGYDVHKYVTEEQINQPIRSMRLGGISIPNAPNVVAHSDGDVLLHALMDALLGCIGGGDIGLHFPDSDKRYDGISSVILIDHVLTKVLESSIKIVHIDATIVAQLPKISQYREAIRSNLSRLLDLDLASVNIKATTEEGLGFTGECKGIKAIVIVTAIRAS